jgi:carbamoyl-phosphate synthase large subunit
MISVITGCSEKLALALGTRGLVNIQYLIYEEELYVIEVNPRASRTVPYLSKITGIPMADIATKVMMGATLEELGYPSGLCQTPPFYGVKAPVFSFEKLPDANSLLGPEMKSTGEVLGIGRTRSEAIYKALRAAGYKCRPSIEKNKMGVLLSLDNSEFSDLPKLAAKLNSLGLRIYATPDTAAAVKSLGVYAFDIGAVCSITALGPLMEKTGIILIIYTGALHDDTMGDYLDLHQQAVRLGIPCLTSVDTAITMADIMASGLNDEATELIDINSIIMPQRGNSKSQGCGYVFDHRFF